MLQQDYLLRQIERLVQIVFELRRRLAGGEVEQVREDLDALADQLGIDLSLAETLEPASLIALLSGGATPHPAKVLAAGELLHLNALLAGRAGAPARAEKNDERARFLLSHVLNTADPIDEDVRERARTLLAEIERAGDGTEENGENV